MAEIKPHGARTGNNDRLGALPPSLVTTNDTPKPFKKLQTNLPKTKPGEEKFCSQKNLAGASYAPGKIGGFS